MDKKYIWKNRLIWAGLVYHSSFHCASDVLERSTHHSTNHCKQKYDDDVSQVKLRVERLAPHLINQAVGK